MAKKKFPARIPYRNADGTWMRKAAWWLEYNAACAFETMRDKFKEKYDKDLLITGAGRTREEQEALYANPAKRGLAARPGTSWHEVGLAVDISTATMTHYYGIRQNEFEAFAAQFGWRRTVANEPWHFEFHDYFPRSVIGYKNAAKAVS